MIKLFSLKQQKKDGTDGGAKSGSGQKKASAAQLRITKGGNNRTKMLSNSVSSVMSVICLMSCDELDFSFQ